ncbi:hypothetical protein SSS_06315 [Sarcoptes scabiei]|uniref:WW domain-containing protein n=1 Tax=Sarcoptes scabiei TaxID=52283 RepID=A0A834VBQ2_SARSC|nr:hypothetical protein SSS_06315 [Sarcoptes scabiei]
MISFQHPYDLERNASASIVKSIVVGRESSSLSNDSAIAALSASPSSSSPTTPTTKTPSSSLTTSASSSLLSSEESEEIFDDECSSTSSSSSSHDSFDLIEKKLLPKDTLEMNTKQKECENKNNNLKSVDENQNRENSIAIVEDDDDEVYDNNSRDEEKKSDSMNYRNNCNQNYSIDDEASDDVGNNVDIAFNLEQQQLKPNVAPRKSRSIPVYENFMPKISGTATPVATASRVSTTPIDYNEEDGDNYQENDRDDNLDGGDNDDDDDFDDDLLLDKEIYLKKSQPPPITGKNVRLKRWIFDHWYEYFDMNGRLFYYNSSTKMSSWKPPRRTTRIDANDISEAVQSINRNDQNGKNHLPSQQQQQQHHQQHQQSYRKYSIDDDQSDHDHRNHNVDDLRQSQQTTRQSSRLQPLTTIATATTTSPPPPPSSSLLLSSSSTVAMMQPKHYESDSELLLNNSNNKVKKIVKNLNEKDDDNDDADGDDENCVDHRDRSSKVRKHSSFFKNRSKHRKLVSIEKDPHRNHRHRFFLQEPFERSETDQVIGASEYRSSINDCDRNRIDHREATTSSSPTTAATIVNTIEDCEDLSPMMIIRKLLEQCPPKDWKQFCDPGTNKIIFHSSKQWFCTRDDDGRIYFYENPSSHISAPPTTSPSLSQSTEIPTVSSYSGQTKNSLSEENPKKTTDQNDRSNDPNLRVESHQQQPQQQQQQHRSRPPQKITSIERNLKSNSFSITDPYQDIQLKGGFKHSRPFQEYKKFIPPPPNKLDSSDIVLHDTLSQARVLISGKNKRKHWSSSYLVLTEHYLYFFKDHKNMLSVNMQLCFNSPRFSVTKSIFRKLSSISFYIINLPSFIQY